MVGFACSSTSCSRASTVLSMMIVPFWHASTTPPRHDGPGWPVGAGGSLTALSKLNVHDLVAPVCAFTIFEYSAAAAPRQPETKASSQARQRTCTWSSSNISRPCTMSFVMNSLDFASFVNSFVRPAMLSSAMFPMTSWRALIFSNLDLLMAVERAMACCVSICFDFRSYSWRILAFVELTTFNFSTLNSCKALALISSALSFASFKMNCVICKIWFCVSAEASIAAASVAGAGGAALVGGGKP
mmetsp:Transcript_5920/g.12036  ORF Transcript_5920/g.12036 Transcript_5920/m.12036 type:complete len:244 (-) Transcript_5920:41-772(-)